MIRVLVPLKIDLQIQDGSSFICGLRESRRLNLGMCLIDQMRKTRESSGDLENADRLQADGFAGECLLKSVGCNQPEWKLGQTKAEGESIEGKVAGSRCS